MYRLPPLNMKENTSTTPELTPMVKNSAPAGMVVVRDKTKLPRQRELAMAQASRKALGAAYAVLQLRTTYGRPSITSASPIGSTSTASAGQPTGLS
ncbi:Uncharacterised protein [Bifidobacterium longum subsp. infantis]|uniref:Uncharacterized protein n=1 Tax=Bifidobacterium longum subsp. infantis TaxID=1682 RepID=A0A564RZ36_BIFLI|nr:Uncharacterised protein [Bifidobacterium longum subsp. infantis]